LATTDLDGKPIDTSQRHSVSKQLTMPQVGETIANNSNPTYVLGGWNPVATR
jgi:pectinesterase